MADRDVYEVVVQVGSREFNGNWWAAGLLIALCVAFGLILAGVRWGETGRTKLTCLIAAVLVGIALVPVGAVLLDRSHTDTWEHDQLGTLALHADVRFLPSAQLPDHLRPFQDMAVEVERDGESVTCSLSRWRRHAETGTWVTELPRRSEEVDWAVRLRLECPAARGPATFGRDAPGRSARGGSQRTQ
ncbi:hypothetical protein HLB23_31575 [Nocardia uniformis]|uniref:Uncharacterized protein n=1 Tax=Nocardia uniformis TaxID=53432 RepID=A0A849CFJ0_9NOCA|nr:hypothetical protein [Nocardia uniformis]NNH74339.1 hypothetical protein [Nocardia uniformis]